MPVSWQALFPGLLSSAGVFSGLLFKAPSWGGAQQEFVFGKDNEQVILVVKNNYSYEKRQRELAKKKKKEEKLQRKLVKGPFSGEDEKDSSPDES